MIFFIREKSVGKIQIGSVSSSTTEKTENNSQLKLAQYSIDLTAGSIFLPKSKTIPLPFLVNMSSTTDTIRVTNPTQASGISSPLKISGLAEGQWFSRGFISVVLVDSNNKILATGFVAALSNWQQTTDFIPFLGTLTFPRQISGNKGLLYLRNNNQIQGISNGTTAVMPVIF